MRTRYPAGVRICFLRDCRKDRDFQISKSDRAGASLNDAPALCVIPAPTCPEAAVLPHPSKKHSFSLPASPRAPRRRRHCNYNSDNNIYSDYYSNSDCNCNCNCYCYCYCNAALFARKRTTLAPVSPMVGGRITQPVPKHSRTAQAAARKPVRSAHRAAGMAYRVREMPTDPK